MRTAVPANEVGMRIVPDEPCLIGTPKSLHALLKLTTAQDILCSCLNPRDLYALARTDRASHVGVQAYLRRAFCVNRLLRRFFSTSEGFRALQACTGTLIAGSTALQLFDRTLYPESDLDMYVELNFFQDIVDFLLLEGYTFRPYRDQANTPQATVQQALCRDGVSDVTKSAAPSKPIWAHFVVLEFRNGERIVEVAVSKSPALDVILSTYHSSCVLNIISYQNAYSLFPRCTFENRESFVFSHPNTPNASTEVEARDKYIRRGWTMLTDPTSSPSAGYSRSEFMKRDRMVGDSYTWTLPLTHDLRPLPPDAVQFRPFSIERHENVARIVLPAYQPSRSTSSDLTSTTSTADCVRFFLSRSPSLLDLPVFFRLSAVVATLLGLSASWIQRQRIGK